VQAAPVGTGGVRDPRQPADHGVHAGDPAVREQPWQLTGVGAHDVDGRVALLQQPCPSRVQLDGEVSRLPPGALLDGTGERPGARPQLDDHRLARRRQQLGQRFGHRRGERR
jgi:hypothetical protein